MRKPMEKKMTKVKIFVVLIEVFIGGTNCEQGE
jgi:hypothetical protein